MNRIKNRLKTKSSALIIVFVVCGCGKSETKSDSSIEYDAVGDACIPKSCDDFVTTCSSLIADGCGGFIECSDACPDPKVCVEGFCCTPLDSCETDACGIVDDACGGGLDCGTCPNPEDVCYQNSCCLPITKCEERVCGVVDNSCGGELDCGTCSNLEDVCYHHVCCSPILECEEGDCGLIDNYCGGEINCGDCSDSNEVCFKGSCCLPIVECDEGVCGPADDSCGGTLECPAPDSCGRCIAGQYGDNSYNSDVGGCEQPTGTWEIIDSWGASTGSCKLSASLPSQISAIENSWWNENYLGPNPRATGSHKICDDNCTVEWDTRTPLEGSGGWNYEQVILRMITPTQVVGTYSVTHDRNDGTECTVVADVTLNKLD